MLETPLPVVRLLTHDGEFHADEVLATAVLSSLWPEAALVRTRDRNTVMAACADPGTVVYDIGGRHDPAMRIFDHHQLDCPLRPDGTPYSAFGLVWKAHGADWLRHIGIAEGLVTGTHAEFDQGVVTAIDLIDNGVVSPDALGPVGHLTLPLLIGDLRREGDTPEGNAAAFEEAVSLARLILERRARRVAVIAAARGEVEAALVAQAYSPILELPRGMQCASAVHSPAGAHVRFVIHPRNKDWVLNAVNLDAPERGLRQPLPATWAGLEFADLAAVSGVPDAIFCHRNLSFAVAGSRDGILEMARLALASEG
jgi:uncharacterized UPF0160 family protein